MKIKVTLSNTGSELDSQTFTVSDKHRDPDEAVNLGAGEIIECWRLSAGDTITIQEV